jgi:pimeloyl-ACP methyl ester carboxylesterase
MIAAIVLAALIIELAVCTAFVYWLWFTRGVPLAASALVIVAAVLACHLALVALTCALARRWRADSSPPLGSPGFLWLVAGETRAFLQTYVLGQVLQPWLAPRDPGRIVPGIAPVLFVHGIYCNAGVWHRQLAYLRREGTPNLFCVNLGPPFADIDRFARELAQHVDDACRACGSSKAIIVAHSMGGLVARAWRARLDVHSHAARLVTIASPHRGSQIARLGAGRCAAQLVPGSEWLSRLEADEAGASAWPVTCILSWHDNLVAPQDSALLQGANSLTLERLGHLELLLDATVHRRVGAEIAAARSECPS